MDLRVRLADYISQVLMLCQHKLSQWYDIEELQLDSLALTSLYFLHTVIDQNETSDNANYLLLIPDSQLADSALGGALMGALLGKYRANYIVSETAALDYEAGDVLLRIPKKGAPELQRVHRVKDGKIAALTGYPRASGILDPPRFHNFVKLLPEAQARQMGFGTYTIHSVAKLANNISGVKKLVKGIDGIVATFPHRLGLVCSPVALKNLQAHLPLPVREWSKSGNPELQLPLAPLVEAARSYDTLKRQAFAQATTRLVCDELLILDANKYCDGNGLFDEIQDGRSTGRYRSLVLVGSRHPKGHHEFHSWEWTPEELAILRSLPCRVPEVQLCEASELLKLYEALKQKLAELTTANGLNLPGILPAFALFCRLVLPPTSRDAQHEAERQTAGLQAWVTAKLTDDVFAEAAIWGDERNAIRSDMNARFAALAAAIQQRNSKFDALRAACAAPAAATWPKSQAKRGKLPPVVLLVPRREAATTATALQAALTPGHAARLWVIPIHQLDWVVAQPALNRPEALWFVPALRLSREEGSELTLYRQLLLLRAQVRILAYQGIEDGRADQLAAQHNKLVEAALFHPGRAHFMGTLRPTSPLPAELVAPVLPPAADDLSALSYVPAAPPTPATNAQFADLDALFGTLETEKTSKAWVPAAAPSTEATEAADKSNELEPLPPDEAAEPDPTDWEATTSLTYQLQFSDNSSECLPATACVYIQPPGQNAWQLRMVAQLLAGDDVYLVRADPQALRAEIARRKHDAMQEIDAMVGLWKNTLRGLLRDFYHQDKEALHRKLRWKGLQVQLPSLVSWLHLGCQTRFPEAPGDVKAIAELEQHHRGSQAILATKLARIEAARRYNDRIVAGYSRSLNSQVHKYLQNNQSLPDDPTLATLLRDTRPRRLLRIAIQATPQPISLFPTLS